MPKDFRRGRKVQTIKVGMERGIAQQAVMSPMSDLMRRRGRLFRVELLTHGNQKRKTGLRGR